MNKADADRLEREASIRAAVRGPDYSRYNQSVAAAKADYQNRREASQDWIRQDRFGHNTAPGAWRPRRAQESTWRLIMTNIFFNCPKIEPEPGPARWTSMAKHLLETLRVFSDAQDPSQCKDQEWVKTTLLYAEPSEATAGISEYTLNVWRLIMSEYPLVFDTVYYTMVAELVDLEMEQEEGVVKEPPLGAEEPTLADVSSNPLPDLEPAEEAFQDRII
ncbi:MAG: hypothetical protein AAF583_02700 [Pseudomonadota bacterium]